MRVVVLVLFGARCREGVAHRDLGPWPPTGEDAYRRQMAEQCQSFWDDLRCQLITDHHSAHAARSAGDVVFHWSEGVAPEYKGRSGYQWMDEQADD